MFEIDLEKHYPKILSNKTVICHIRKRPINHIPEESIRQAFIKYLNEEKGYPIERMEIEVPLSRFSDELKGRADLLIYDDIGNVLCLVEVKRQDEILTDRIFDQVEYYVECVKPETICLVIGNRIHFLGYDENNNDVILANVPSYESLMTGLENEEIIIPPEEDFSNLEFSDDDVSFLLDNAIIGADTKNIYYNFLIKLYNLYYNKNSKIEIKNNIDLGIKPSKFGNAGGGFFFGDYRSFLNLRTDKTISFAISSITKGENYPTYTSLMFAVEEKGNFHHSLQLNVDKNVEISNNLATISHDGTITVGKLGAAKRSEVVKFIYEKKPELLVNDKIVLGTLNIENEIDFNSEHTHKFIENCIDYALLRDEFRLLKKSNR